MSKKQWRNADAQASHRLRLFNELAPEIGIEAAYQRAYRGRIGKSMRDSIVKIKPAPSFLVQGLLQRGGYAFKQELGTPTQELRKPTIIGRIGSKLRAIFSR